MEGRPPPTWRRDQSVKKDILAAITFLTTGLLFYLAQVDGIPRQGPSAGDECKVMGTIAVEKGAPETSAELHFNHPGTRDS